jgi:hypothetical protein
MLRFTRNRWWAFVLTLCLFTVCALLLTAQAPAYAGARSANQQKPANEDPPMPSFGDPDVPMGPGDGRTGMTFVSRGGGVGSQVVQQNGACPAGDGVAPNSVVMDRLRLIVLGLRSFYLRF